MKQKLLMLTFMLAVTVAYAGILTVIVAYAEPYYHGQ